MKPESTRPEWVPSEGGEAFATKIVTGVPPPPIFSTTGSISPVPPSDVTLLARRILTGDRMALARGITLVESRSPAHRAAADDLLGQVTIRAGGALRIGITGVPGAGKSTFIDALGLQMCEAGWRVAVLSVDPSSPVTGGSILGDKTRMERLSRHPSAFIRPSPSGGELGGVARRTRETITLCEAAGFDTVLVETVGVGQSEVVVRGMVDCFVVLMIAGAGDELQGMKKGILELADVLIVNKADGDNRVRAEAARLEFSRALHYLAGQEGEWQVPVLACSAQTGEGVDGVWQAIERFITQSRGRGEFDARRGAQQLTWLQALIEEGLRERLLGDAIARAEHAEIVRQVESGTLLPAAGARRLLQNLGWERKHKRRE
jgi:LAO/AO transport system kinase